MRSLSSSQSDIVFLYLINMFNPTIFQESCVAWLSGLPHFGIGIGYKQNVSYCHWAPAKAAKNRKHGPKVQSVTWARWDLRFGFYGWLFPYDIIRSSRFGNWTKYKGATSEFVLGTSCFDTFNCIQESFSTCLMLAAEL